MMLMPSNDPYGKFVVASSSRFIQVESSDQSESLDLAFHLFVTLQSIHEIRSKFK